MSSSEDAVEAILKAQSSAWDTYPKLIQRAALPPIAPKTTPSVLIKTESIEQSRPATSSTSRPPSTTIGFPALPKLPLPTQQPLEPIIEKPQTPLYPIPRTNISYMLNLNDIDENEVLRPDSVSSTVIDSDREIERKLLRIPDTFSEFRELSVDLDQVTMEDIDKMLQTTSPHDHHNNGLVSMSSLLNSIRMIHPSDTWQHLLDWLIATSIEEDKETEPASTSSNVVFLIDYQLFFEVLQNDKQAREVLINIPEVLESDDNGSIFSHLPSRPTSSQEQRERGRARLLVDLEIILSANPDINIERFKFATDKKIISVEELKMMFQIYGITEHIQHIEQRIIDCFLTHEQYFCFSAFVGCLSQINHGNNHFRSQSPSIPVFAPKPEPPVRKLDDSGVVADLDTTGSSFHL